jgi:hypothetical protein
MPATPGRPLIAVSSGKLISCSTSSGAMPPASVITVTVGLLRSGKTSTGRRVACKPPQIISTTAADQHEEPAGQAFFDKPLEHGPCS